MKVKRYETEIEAMQFDIYTLLFAGLAVFVIIKLRSVLGTRTGDEKPPFDPFKPRDPVPPNTAGDNVIALPSVSDRNPPPPAEPAPARWEGLAAQGSPLAAGFDELARADRNFDPRAFQTGARAAYEMIVTAFAKGDRKTLKDLLSKDVFDNFSGVITGREQRGETNEATFVSIDKVEIIDAALKAATMLLTVRFVSKIIAATRDRSGAVIEGSPDKVADVTDIWTFAHEISARDPNWKLVTTEAGQ
jgi:predicted lipid-binding transport protein (Tim44 family)